MQQLCQQDTAALDAVDARAAAAHLFNCWMLLRQPGLQGPAQGWAGGAGGCSRRLGQAFTASSTPGTGSQSGHASRSSCPCKLPVPWDPAAAEAQAVQGSPCRLGEVRGGLREPTRSPAAPALGDSGR